MMRLCLLFLLFPLVFSFYGCAAGAATAAVAARANQCDHLTVKGMNEIANTVKEKVISDLENEGYLKSDREIYRIVIERMEREGLVPKE